MSIENVGGAALDSNARQHTGDLDSASGAYSFSGAHDGAPESFSGAHDGAPESFTIAQTRAQFENNCTKLRTFGMNINGDSGELVHDGIVVDFSFADPVLTITEKKTPMLVSEGFVKGKILAWFNTNDTSAVRSEKTGPLEKPKKETEGELPSEEWARKK